MISLYPLRDPQEEPPAAWVDGQEIYSWELEEYGEDQSKNDEDIG